MKPGDERTMNNYEMLTQSAALYLDTSVLVKIDAKEEAESRFVRLLVYCSGLPVYCSAIGFGELVGVLGQKRFQRNIGPDGFLFRCREFMKETETGKIRRVEPPEDRGKFVVLANRLLPKYGHLGGGDVWHLMSALSLNEKAPGTAFLSFESRLVQAALTENLSAVNPSGMDADTLVCELKRIGRWMAD